MATFIGQLIGFAVIVLIIVKFAVPPVRKLMREQQEQVRTQLDDSAHAARRLADADEYHSRRVEEGRVEARHIVDEASTDSTRIAEQLRTQGQVESERIRVYGLQQVDLLRSQMVREMRAGVGSEAVRRAAEIVRERVADPHERSRTVDRFLDELEAMAPVAKAPEVSSTELRPASRDAQLAMVARFDAASAAAGLDDLTRMGDELTAVAALLIREPVLARHLSEAGGLPDAKAALLRQLLADRVGDATMDVLTTAVTARWSSTDDLVSSIALVAHLSLLARAEREQQSDEVADQIFRFGRILDEQPALNALLSASHEPAAGRVGLLRSVLGDVSGVLPTTTALLSQTVELLRRERADEAVKELARLAVARRGEVIAEVSAAAELTESQRERLGTVLARIYRHPVSVQLSVDPALLGGLAVAVGDEIIDGTLSSRLALAATRLPD